MNCTDSQYTVQLVYRQSLHRSGSVQQSVHRTGNIQIVHNTDIVKTNLLTVLYMYENNV